MGLVFVTNIKGATGATGPQNPAQERRFEAIETLVAEPGSRVENLVPDPKPVAASPASFGAGRVDITQAPGSPFGWGRAMVTAVGAASFYPMAGGVGALERFSAKAGERVASSVILRGHPTQDMGATLNIIGYRWTGTTFVDSNIPVGITSGQFKIVADARVTFEAVGTIPAGCDATHFLPTVTFRRWAETYPQAGDWLYWRNWTVQSGPGAPASSPVIYIDGDTAGAYWLGDANNSASISLSPRTDSGQGALNRDMLVTAFKDRRGGRVGTAGRAAVALRFDHWLTPFVADIYPTLVRLGLPWAQIQNPETIGTTGNNAWTYAQMQDACLNTGGEVVNHGGNHLDAIGTEAIRAQIVGSLTTLKANLPRLAIESWAPPGLAAGRYGGYAPMATIAQHTETVAGRLVLSNHAGVSGYVGGPYRPLGGELSIGQAHYTMDTATASTVDAVVRGAIAAQAGLVLMIHPNYVDTSGYMSKADLIAVLENLAARRDAGEIDILTLSGLMLADTGTASRHDLVVNGRFSNGLNNWANTTGWALTTVAGLTYATTTTGTPLTQVVSFTRTGHLLGGSRELVYKVRATSGAIVRTAAVGNGINATKDHTLPASPAWREVRQPLVIPGNLTGNLTVSAGRVSGGAVDIADIRLQTI